MNRLRLAAGFVGLATLFAVPAQAQYYWAPFGARPPIIDYYPRPPAYIPGPMDEADDAYTAGEVMYLLRQQGYRVTARPRRSGSVFVAEAASSNGQRLRIVVGAYDGDIRSATAIQDRRPARPAEERNQRAAVEPPIQGERPITVAPLAPPAAAPALRPGTAPAPEPRSDTRPADKPQRPAVVRPSRTPAKPTQPDNATQEAKPAPRVILPNPVESKPLVPNEPLKVETPPPAPAPAPQVATPAAPPATAAPAAAPRAAPAPAPIVIPPPSTLDEIKPKSPATETLPVPPVTLD